MTAQAPFRLVRQEIGGLPIVERTIGRMGLQRLLTEATGSARCADAILLLLKNVLIDRNALYAIPEWASRFDPALVQGGGLGDDAIARALDRLFRADRASLLTRIVLTTVGEFSIDLGEIHQDTTSVKLYGAYAQQSRRGVQLKRGHSKDHRPDLKQLVYELSITRDGAIPVLFKAHDGNRTDDTLHWENWQSLRGLLGRSDFLYVADSKLCVKRTLMNIDRSQGRFVTILPRTRAEVGEFAESVCAARVRWERALVKRSTRRRERMDLFELAVGLHQMREGFRVHWFRSSEKRRRDKEDREQRIDQALDHLRSLDEGKRRGPQTEAALKRRADKILLRFGAKEWVRVEVALERVEQFKQKTRGRAAEDTDYRRIVKWVPRLNAKRELEAIAKDEAMDGVFPLATNTELKAVDVLNAYKYQPRLEKRHALLKSGMKVAPVFLKKNERIEALMLVYFLAQLVSSLIERELRAGMIKHDVPALLVLPEERASKHPTTEQVLRVFAHRAKHTLRSRSGDLVQTFTDPLTPVQQQILRLMAIQPSAYC